MKPIGIVAAVLLGVSAMGCSNDVATQVTREAYEGAGKTWPLSVANGEVGCDKIDGPYDADARWFLAPDGTRYGLNGFATEAAGYKDITPIWLEDEAMNRQVQKAFPNEPLRIRNRLSLGALIDDAGEKC